MPDGITDRAADVWEPLIAIADAAGGRLARTGTAGRRRDQQRRLERDPSLGVQLLADCRRVFADRPSTGSPPRRCSKRCIDLDESPWADLRGKPLDARGLARRLRKYDVRPDVHRFDDGTHRGYRLEDFHDAWQRYLPA